jgi:hypothetical protein
MWRGAGNRQRMVATAALWTAVDVSLIVSESSAGEAKALAIRCFPS